MNRESSFASSNQLHDDSNIKIEESFSVVAPSRIHFGLFSVSRDTTGIFGGMGAMVSEPTIEIRLKANKTFGISGLHPKLVGELVQTWHHTFGDLIPDAKSVEDLPFEISLTKCPARHVGFGTGTQLAFSVAALLFNAIKISVPSANELALGMNRGKRSAIGSHGFLQGGFLVDRGIVEGEKFSALQLRLQFPDEWRFLLITPKKSTGIHGQLENLSFQEITKNVVSRRANLEKICSNNIVPAISNKNYQALGEPLFEFNRISGEYFKDFQFGFYHDQLCDQIVKDLRSLGVSAVGQSSWGPCIFAIAQNDQHASEIKAQLERNCPDRFSADNVDIKISSVSNQGAIFSNSSVTAT